MYAPIPMGEFVVEQMVDEWAGVFRIFCHLKTVE